MAASMDAEVFHPTSEDLDEIHALEAKSYPEDEAASRKSLAFRLENAREYFLAAREGKSGELLGFVCGTLVPAKRLTHSSMSKSI